VLGGEVARREERVRVGVGRERRRVLPEREEAVRREARRG